jgi:hypothetical protein
MLIDALSYVFGMATLLLIAIPGIARAAGEKKEGVLHEALIGWRYVRGRVSLLGLLTVYGVNNFVFAIACVLIAPLLLSFSNPVLLGLQYAISGCGLLLGGALMTALGGPKKQANGVLLYSILGGVFLAVHGLRPSYVLVTAAGFVLFMMLPVISASNASLWQRKVPSQLHGRCFAIQQLLLHAVTAIGYCVAGPLSDRVFEPLFGPHGTLAGSVGAVIGIGPGRGIAFVFILLGALMTLVAAWAWSVPAIRHADDMEEAPAEAAGAPLAIEGEQASASGVSA